MIQRKPFRSYLLMLSTVMVLSAAAIMVLAFTVDPFGMYRFVEIDGFNASKPRMYANARLVKAYYVREARPHGLILGSSRADVGLNADHPGWKAASRPVFNSALPSMRMREVYDYLRHAQAQAGLKQLVIGLDFFMFDAKHEFEPGFDPNRLDLNGHRWISGAFFKDYFRTLMSYDAITATWDTLTFRKGFAVRFLRNGGQDPSRRQQNISNKGGHHAAFESALSEIVVSQDALLGMTYGPSSISRNRPLSYLDDVLAYCEREGISVYLIVSPVHALWLEAIWELGLWPEYERWKRDLSRIVDRYARSTVPQRDVQLWDFTGFNPITMESVPPRDRPEMTMEWYWEASHYKRETGDLVLSRVFGSERFQVPNSFGVRLTESNVEAHLQALREARIRYAASYPQSVQIVWEVLFEEAGEISRRSRMSEARQD